MIEEIARDLKIAVSDDGLTAAPDSAQMVADIQVPVHQAYDMDIVERIVQRYEKILEGAAMNRKPSESSLSDRQSS